MQERNGEHEGALSARSTHYLEEIGLQDIRKGMTVMNV